MDEAERRLAEGDYSALYDDPDDPTMQCCVCFQPYEGLDEPPYGSHLDVRLDNDHIPHS